MTVLPEMMHVIEDSPISRYLEAKNNDYYVLNTQVISLLKLLLTGDYNLRDNFHLPKYYHFLKFYVYIGL